MTRSQTDPIVAIARALSGRVDELGFGDPVTHVYNPLDYARATHEQYLRRYARPGVATVLLGMNPGPWGMAQTGVPFGEVEAVRSWLGIEGGVERPDPEHPKRPVEGLACTRSEVSGRRLWGWAQERFATPDRFFDQFFVWNYCPLSFMEEGGRNRTPDKLPAAERGPLFTACDEALRAMLKALSPERVLGVGKFAEDRVRAAYMGEVPFALGRILHPSPASPAANRGWAPQVEAQLAEMGIRLPG